MAEVAETVDTTLGSAVENVIKKVDPLKDAATPPESPKVDLWTPSKSPSSSPKAASASVPTGDKTGDMKAYLKEIALWEQPKLSAKVLAGLVYVYYSTCCGRSFVGFLCYMLFLRLMIVAGPRMAAERLEKAESGITNKAAAGLKKVADKIEQTLALPSAAQVTFVVRGIAEVVEQKSFSAADAIEKAGKDSGMLKVVCVHLLGLMFLLRIISIWNIIFLGAFIGLTVPAIYTKQKDKIDPLLEQLKEKSKPHVEKAKMKGKELMEKGQAKGQELMDKAVAKIKEIREKKGAAATATPAEAKKTN